MQWASAQELGKLSDDSAALKLAAPLQWLALPKGAVQSPGDFDEATTAKGFAVLTPGTQMPASTERDIWLRFTLPATASPELWYLRVPHLSLERSTLYFQDHQGSWKAHNAGEAVAMANWPVPASRPTYALQTRTDQAQSYYLKLSHHLSITKPPELISVNEYVGNASHIGVLTGLMLGLFGLLGILGTLSARTYRNTHFTWFTVVVFTLTLMQLVLIGYAGQHIWPHSVYLNQTMCWLSWLWYLAAATWFCTYVSSAEEVAPKIYAISVGLTITLLCASLVYALAHHLVPQLLLNVLAITVMLWMAGSIAWIAWRSQPWLWYVAAGVAPLSLTLFTRIAYNMGWVSDIETAQIISMLVGSLGLLVIYRALVQRNRATQLAVVRDSAADNLDVSTGLFLPRVVSVRLPLVLARSERFAEPCGVLMVRWQGYKEFMEPLSSSQRGTALANLGSRLHKLGRPIDTVARLDDDHFVYLIESPITRERLNALGTKILSVCMRSGRPQVDPHEYNVHVAIWTSTKGHLETAQVIEALRTRLNQMGNGTSRRVQFADSAPSSRPGDGNSEMSNVTGITALSSADIVAKINAIEASPIIPTIAATPTLKAPSR
jgi:two-component system, sensor histidine kinase LadS